MKRKIRMKRKRGGDWLRISNFFGLRLRETEEQITETLLKEKRLLKDHDK